MNRVHICSFEAVGQIKRGTTYEQFRAVVLRAGRFSVFEATETQQTARLYTRLANDSRVKLTPIGFPWTKVEVAE